jgi:hypothetical protein
MKTRKIQFDTINGTVEVENFDQGIWEYGYIYDYVEICSILNHHEAETVGGMIVNEENFARVKEEYGIE